MKNSLFSGKYVIVYGEVKWGNIGLEIIYLEYWVYGENIGVEL